MLTVDHRASPFPLSGQCAGGVRQTGEIAARMIADVVTWAPLPLLYALPFAGLVNLDGGTLSDLILICYMLMWVMQPIGYVVTLLNRANATVAVSSLSLILTIFLSTQLGPNLTSPASKSLLALSPARWATASLVLSYTAHAPHGAARVALEASLLQTGVLQTGAAPDGGGYHLKKLPSERAQMLSQMRAVASYHKFRAPEAFRRHLAFCASETPWSGENASRVADDNGASLTGGGVTGGDDLALNMTNSSNATASNATEGAATATNASVAPGNASSSSDGGVAGAAPPPPPGEADDRPLEWALLQDYDALPPFDWLGAAMLVLFEMGASLRLMAVALFYKRSRTWEQIVGPRAIAFCCGPLAWLLRVATDIFLVRCAHALCPQRLRPQPQQHKGLGLPDPVALPPVATSADAADGQARQPRGRRASPASPAPPQAAVAEPTWGGWFTHFAAPSAASEGQPRNLTLSERSDHEKMKHARSMRRLLRKRSHKDDGSAEKDRPGRHDRRRQASGGDGGGPAKDSKTVSRV